MCISDMWPWWKGCSTPRLRTTVLEFLGDGRPLGHWEVSSKGDPALPLSLPGYETAGLLLHMFPLQSGPAGQAVDHFWKIELKQTPSQLTAFLSCYSDRSRPSPTVANVWKSLSRIPSPRAKTTVHTYNLFQPSLLHLPGHLPVAVLHRNNRLNATGYLRKSPKQSWECFNGDFEEENNIEIRHVEKL